MNSIQHAFANGLLSNTGLSPDQVKEYLSSSQRSSPSGHESSRLHHLEQSLSSAEPSSTGGSSRSGSSSSSRPTQHSRPQMGSEHSSQSSDPEEAELRSLLQHDTGRQHASKSGSMSRSLSESVHAHRQTQSVSIA